MIRRERIAMEMGPGPVEDRSVAKQATTFPLFGVCMNFWQSVALGRGFAHAAILAIALLSTHVLAEPATVPVLQLGESWSYRFNQDGKDLGTYTQTVSTKLGDGTVEILVDDGRVLSFDEQRHRVLREYSVDRVSGARALLEDNTDSDVPFRFPLEVGAKWKVRTRYLNKETNYKPLLVVQSAEVVRKEQIRTPAGTFDCFRIELTGHWLVERIASEGASGRQNEIDWFAPSVKRVVRREIKAYGASAAKMWSTVLYDRTDELVAFRLAP